MLALSIESVPEFFEVAPYSDAPLDYVLSIDDKISDLDTVIYNLFWKIFCFISSTGL